MSSADGWACTRTGRVVYKRKQPKIWRWSDALRVTKALSPPVNLDIATAFQVVTLMTLRMAFARIDIPVPQVLQRLAVSSGMFALLQGLDQFVSGLGIDFDLLLSNYLGLTQAQRSE